ncbi:MAG: FAD-binding protein [Streptosporangiaceae bacterium]
MDLSRLNRVLEVDGISGAALIEAGATGPEINRQLAAFGRTLRHHHPSPRRRPDHRPWYDSQRPEPFALAVEAAKAALDPRGVLNPGVLIGAPVG